MFDANSNRWPVGRPGAGGGLAGIEVMPEIAAMIFASLRVAGSAHPPRVLPHDLILDCPWPAVPLTTGSSGPQRGAAGRGSHWSARRVVVAAHVVLQPAKQLCEVRNVVVGYAASQPLIERDGHAAQAVEGGLEIGRASCSERDPTS